LRGLVEEGYPDIPLRGFQFHLCPLLCRDVGTEKQQQGGENDSDLHSDTVLSATKITLFPENRLHFRDLFGY
jgi:hypothetical protein